MSEKPDATEEYEKHVKEILDAYKRESTHPVALFIFYPIMAVLFTFGLAALFAVLMSPLVKLVMDWILA